VQLAFAMLFTLPGVPTVYYGDEVGLAVQVGAAGILVVGLFDTVIDTPRFLLLLVLLAGIGALPPPKASA